MEENNTNQKEDMKMKDKDIIEIRPAVDILESNDGLKLVFEVPGANSKTVDVEVDNGVLTVKADSVITKGGYPVRFARAFQLSDAVDVEGITAKTCDGLLTLHLPKSVRAAVHKITVQ
jgi:HSP20 family molecular chaperone IbpA